MVELQSPIIYDDFSSGVIDDVAVSESLLPRNAVRKAVNCVFDAPRGGVSGRLGSTVVGSTLASRVRGLYNFRDSGTGTNHRLLVTDNGGITYYLDGANFTSTLSGDTPSLKTRFVTFLDRVARMNGTDAIKTWNGSGTWSTGGDALDAANWPSRSKFAVVFNSRIYTAGDSTNPDTLSYSTLPSSGALTWTGTGSGSLQINPNDGAGGITGLGTNGTVVMTFKKNALYRWDGSSTFANNIIPIGTPSHESIATHNSGWLYFFGEGLGGVGVYRTTGGYPQLISRNIQRWIDSISSSSYENVASFVDDDHYYLAVGSITVDGITYSNAWYVYTISSQGWHIENRADTFSVFAQYIDSNDAVTIVGGDTDGNVQTINSGTTDNTAAISAECEFAPAYFTTRARTKTFGRVTTYATYFQGLTFFLKTDTNDFYPLGEIKDTEQHFGGAEITRFGLFRGKRFYPKISVSNSQAAWQFDGYEFSEVIDEGDYQ